MNRLLPDINEEIFKVVMRLHHFPFAPRAPFCHVLITFFSKDGFSSNINHSKRWGNAVFSHLKTVSYGNSVSGVGFYLTLLPLAKDVANGSNNKHRCNMLMIKGGVKAGEITHPPPRTFGGGEITLFCWQQVQPPECGRLTHHEKYSERKTDSESDGQ
ncbi:hypothetical protein WH279_01070 [Erwinia sp. MYb375]|uniref:hypothetical protein n=1 Tax=unclassified Erwinia TaxID=2622719 RepID=UPI0030B70357